MYTVIIPITAKQFVTYSMLCLLISSVLTLVSIAARYI